MKKILLSTILASSLMAFDIGGILNSAKSLTTQNSTTTGTSNLDNSIVSSGLKEALQNGITFAVNELGKQNGYLNNPNVKIPLPQNLQRVESIIRKAGGDKIADDLILSMNSAASEAAPKTAEIFMNSISKMSLSDANAILNSGEHGATEYFKKTTTTDLTATIKPIIQKSIQNNSVAQYYDGANNLYKSTLGNSSIGALASSFGLGASEENLDDFITTKAIDGLFFMIGEKEAAIRANPIEQTSTILKQVFGK